MANFCISVYLVPSCYNRNYLESVCRQRARVFRGRKYEFVWSTHSLLAFLHCNGVCIGVIDKGRISIYSQFKTLIPTESYLCSLIALFNLYPC